MFMRSKMDAGLTPPIEYHKSAEAIVLGEALVMAGNGLTKCGATAKPDYMAVGPVNEGVAPVIKVQDYIQFEAPVEGGAGSLKVGDKVTLSADGLGVTDTTDGGVATIVAIEGDTVVVRF